MKNNSKLKWLSGFSVLFIILALAGGVYKWNQQKLAYQNSQIEVDQLFNSVPNEISQIKKAYQARNQYLMDLLSNPKLKASTPTQQLKVNLGEAFKQMNENDLLTTEQINRFERLAAYVNQLITNEVLNLNKNRKSILFTEQKQVRELERFDLAVDSARKSFAETSWKLLQLKTTMEKNWTHKSSIATKPYFPADVMVIDHQKKNLTKIL